MTQPMHRLTRPGGIEVPYAVLGAEGPPHLLFAHALMGTGLQAGRESFAPFIDAGWAIATVDQRGHGEGTASVEPDDYQIEALAQDLVAVLDALGWSTAWLCGASMGAAPAIHAAVTVPDRVDGLVLFAPAFGEKPNAAAGMFARVADALRAGGVEQASTVWREEMDARGVSPEAVEGHLAQMRQHDPAAMAVWMREIGSWTLGESLGRLSGVDVPVVVVAWEDDDIHPAALARRIADASSPSVLEMIDPATASGPDFLFRVALDGIQRLQTGRVS